MSNNPCDFLDPVSCIQKAVGGTSSTATNAAWNEICRSFADAASGMLQAFGTWFTKAPGLNLRAAGITVPYGISLVIGSAVAALLIFGQVIRTAWTHDGSPMAQALSGTVKAVLAWMLTAAVTTAGLAASDQVTQFIVTAAFGSQQGLAGRLTSVVNWSGLTQAQPAQATTGAAFLLVIGITGLVLVAVLWFELLLRNAALAVLVAVAPIPAAGQASEATKSWWPRTVAAGAQLVILKPVIALVFAVGFGMAGQSSGVAAVLQGLLVLGLAAFAWPIVARFFTFTSVQAANAGLSAVLGFAAGTLARRGGGGPAGVRPGQFSQASEGRVMGGAGGASGAGGGGRGGAVLAGIGMALQKAHEAGSALAGRMEQTAGHAGMPGAYPYSTLSGRQPVAPPRYGSGQPAGATGPASPASVPWPEQGPAAGGGS
jgi:hypothetical protein